MYRTCIHCQQPLGANEMIEALPIGRRLAFDADKGRLWVVCRRCERWNLTPFDARWEALEQCERAYRDTRVRLSTDNIGLARLADGTDLVRVGKPLRPEFAAWRYGDQLDRRRRQQRQKILVGSGIVVAGGMIAAGVGPLLASVGGLLPAIQVVNVANSFWQLKRRREGITKNAVTLGDGQRIYPTGVATLVQLDVEERWGIRLGTLSDDALAKKSAYLGTDMLDGTTITVRGRDAMPLLRKIMPTVNRSGATPHQVREGVEMIEQAGGSNQFGGWAASQRGVWAAKMTFGDTGSLAYLPVAARLALEMAVNEDAERRALEGELQQLEAAWREAEEVAGIADRLTPMQAIERKLESLRIRRR